MTVMWHVDNLKISHKDERQVTKFILKISKTYGKKISFNRRKVHDYLGMDLDYPTPGSIRVGMSKYVSNLLASFPEVIKSTAEFPVAEHLFQTRDGNPSQEFLPEEQARAFHYVVAQLLFLYATALAFKRSCCFSHSA